MAHITIQCTIHKHKKAIHSATPAAIIWLLSAKLQSCSLVAADSQTEIRSDFKQECWTLVGFSGWVNGATHEVIVGKIQCFKRLTFLLFLNHASSIIKHGLAQLYSLHLRKRQSDSPEEYCASIAHYK